MKQFSLDEYLKNSNRKLITRDGKSVRIICLDRKGANYPIIALIDNEKGSEYMMTYDSNGRSYCSIIDAPYDLFFAPEKKEYWLNIYRDACGVPFSGGSYKTEKEAIKNKSLFSDYIDTVKIEYDV